MILYFVCDSENSMSNKVMPMKVFANYVLPINRDLAQEQVQKMLYG